MASSQAAGAAQRSITPQVIPLCILLLCLCSIVTVTEGQGRRVRNRNPPPAGLTLDYVYGRMRNLERKLQRTQQEVSQTQEQIKSIESKLSVGASDGGGGGGGSSAASSSSSRGQRLSDLGPCPIRAEGFKYAPKFKSCYRMEASDVLVNQTEASRLCRMMGPRSDLVSIETADEQQFLKSVWQEERGVGSLVRFWTSARRNGLNWKWESSDLPMKYSNWIPTTEHNDDRFSCVAVYSNEAFTWIDVACWAPHLVTCEVNL